MITCREFADFIGAWFDHELPESQQREFQEHMDVCPWCVAYLESYKTTVALEKSAFSGDDALPSDVPEELVQAIVRALKAT